MSGYITFTCLAAHITLTCLTARAFPTVIAPPCTVRFSVAGPKGNEGQGIVWKGNYSETTAYAAMDAVVYNGSSYICTLACTGVIPTETSHWSIFASAAGEWTELDFGSFQ